MSICTEYCEKCIYKKSFSNGSLPYCDYYMMTGERRPCPAGDGCTVRITTREFRKQKRTPAQEAAYREKQRQQERERRRRYYQNNKERVLARNKKWQQEHKAHLAEYAREYRKKNKEE